MQFSDYNSNLTTSNSLNTVHGANYVKIGRIVHCNFNVRLTTASGSPNFGMTLWLSGVPFNVSTDYQGNTGTVIGAYTIKNNSQALDRYTGMSVGVVSTGVGGYERIYLSSVEDIIRKPIDDLPNILTSILSIIILVIILILLI